jgi:hypothetical protein
MDVKLKRKMRNRIDYKDKHGYPYSIVVDIQSQDKEFIYGIRFGIADDDEEQIKISKSVIQKITLADKDKFDSIIKDICFEYGILPDEFNSQFSYGSLPEARYLYCLILDTIGLRNKHIAEVAGFSPPRVTISISKAKKLMNDIPYFKQKHDAIVGSLLNIYNTGT